MDAFHNQSERTEVDRLLETWLREQARGVGDTTARRDDLPSTTVNGISVELKRSVRDEQMHERNKDVQ